MLNPIAVRKAKIAYNFGLSECNKVKLGYDLQYKNICSWQGARVHTDLAPEFIKLLCSTQLSIEFFLLINVKMPTIVGILTFMSRKNSIIGLLEPGKSWISWYFYIYEHLKFHAQLSWAWKTFYKLRICLDAMLSVSRNKDCKHFWAGRYMSSLLTHWVKQLQAWHGSYCYKLVYQREILYNKDNILIEIPFFVHF